MINSVSSPLGTLLTYLHRPNTFFKKDLGFAWKQGMDDYISKHPNMNMGKFKVHVIELAYEYSFLENRGTIPHFIEERTDPFKFQLRPEEPGYREEKGQNIVLKVLWIIGEIFLNIVTLGFASYFWMHRNGERLNSLNEEKAGLKEFQKSQAKRLQENSPAANVLVSLYQERVQRNIDKEARLEKKRKETEEKLCILLKQKKDVEAFITSLLKPQEQTENFDEREREELAKAIELSKKMEKKLSDQLDPSYTGFIDSVYTKRESDEIAIESKWRDIAEVKKEGKSRIPVFIPTPEGKWMKNKKNMEELLESAFLWAREELMKKKIDSAILKQEGDLPLYKFMVYLMIHAAGVNNTCDDPEPNLVLSRYKGEDLVVNRSHAYRAKKREGEGYDILYQKHDSWTPIHPQQFPRGIDPLGVKWILKRLEAKEALLLELQKKLLNIKQEDASYEAEVMHEINLADQLIGDIALVLRERYRPLFEKLTLSHPYS